MSKTNAELKDQVQQTLPDNTTGAIAPTAHRQMLDDQIDSQENVNNKDQPSGYPGLEPDGSLSGGTF